MRFVMLGVAAILLAGCATQYEDPSFISGGNGVTASRLDATTFRISARGNAFTSPDAIEKFVLRKASEETLASGNEWFLLLSLEDRSRTGQVVIPGSSQTTMTGVATGHTFQGSAMSTYNPAQTMTTHLPGRSILIRVGGGSKPAGAFDAREVLKFVAQ